MRFLAVQLGIDIGPTHEEQPVETPDEIACDFGSDALRGHHNRLAAATKNGFHVATAGKCNRIARHATRNGGATCNGDQRRHVFHASEPFTAFASEPFCSTTIRSKPNQFAISRSSSAAADATKLDRRTCTSSMWLA